MRKAAVLFIFIGAIVFSVSCDKKRVYDEYKPITEGWNKDSTIVFKLGRLDTVQNYNLFINIRNNKDYNYSNLFLITEMRFPQGKVVTDTLEYEMAAPDGTWLGTGFGDVKESKLWYKENVSFTEPGEYQIAIQQAMRKNDAVEGIESLEGITHVGFRIEKDLQ
ncbi:protein involved in gliding motility GldH [Salegentibacter sp. 24]|jgi:gliding motility-associated lipoprotein GldH|uniref:gliding motility lipoprotein GldH n=1 Tax=Salegentibacter sp. 24 TaxID=2183986 RepID=UPI001060468A|nr:gliding motility lipoprotein GldH [Salegentibacter sp. 24]TDN87362.1 protein involved in gliding motility GldH [Salegentibacter sp. 24]